MENIHEDLASVLALETQKVLDDVEREKRIWFAAFTLGSRPKGRRRIYTGAVGGRRIEKGHLVRLPDGRFGRVQGAARGKALVWIDDPNAIGGYCELVANTDDLIIHRDPAARLLGGLKRGSRERVSPKKIEAVRRNGSRPVRPGHRRRGRPNREEYTEA